MSVFHERPRVTVVKHGRHYVRFDSYVGLRPGMSALYSMTRWLADTWTTIALLALICALSVGAWSLMHWLTGVAEVTP